MNKAIHFNLTPELHRAFKAKASAEGKSIKAVLLEFIKSYTQEAA